MTLTIDVSENTKEIKVNEFRENRIETSVHSSFPQLNNSCRLHPFFKNKTDCTHSPQLESIIYLDLT